MHCLDRSKAKVHQYQQRTLILLDYLYHMQKMWNSWKNLSPVNTQSQHLDDINWKLSLLIYHCINT